MTPAIPAEDLDRLRRWMHGGRRCMLGLVGCPGAGKSTLAEALKREIGASCQVVPMDGYHLANAELQRLGFQSRKGAPHTFDAAGYVGLLQRLRTQREGEIVYAPEFRREIEEPIAGAIPVFHDTQLIITEGNYLLLDQAPWSAIPSLLDETWYVDVDDDLRNERLVARHERYGRSREAALAWIAGNDALNAEAIAASRPRAQHVFRWE